MELLIADESVRLLGEQLAAEEARARVEEEKLSLFGNLNKLFFRPRAGDVEIVASEKRYEPFWYVAAHSDYQFERRGRYRVPVPKEEVKRLTLEGKEVSYDVTGERAFTLQVTEHCHVERTREVFVDAVSGEARAYADYLAFPVEELEELAAFEPEGATLVPPQIRASFVVRDLLGQMMKEAMPAEVVRRDLVEITCICLYLRPVYAFECRWSAKEKVAVAEVDGVTGALQQSSTALNQQLGRMLSSELLFDIGTDAVELLVPGGGIALKVGRALVDHSRK